MHGAYSYSCTGNQAIGSMYCMGLTIKNHEYKYKISTGYMVQNLWWCLN